LFISTELLSSPNEERVTKQQIADKGLKAVQTFSRIKGWIYQHQTKLQ
jgi:hypothetical protein